MNSLHHSNDTAKPARAHILSVATAVGPFTLDQQRADQLLTQHYADILRPRALDVMHKVLSNPGVRTRHLAVESLEELLRLKDEDPDARVRRFTYWSVSLACQAATRALARAGRSASDVRALVVNTCTGYLCPGISTYCIEQLGLSADTVAHDLVGAGCGGALPNLDMGTRLADDPDGVVLCISTEICTATFEMGNDISLIVSNAIFGDGAAAVVVGHGTRGMAYQGGMARFLPQYREDVRYTHKKGRLHNQLSSRLPEVIGAQVPRLIQEFLAHQEMTPDDIDFWLVHPGGVKMIETIRDHLGLDDAAVRYAWEILRDYGNMSSPTVLFELERIDPGNLPGGRRCLLVGYGAGLSMHVALLTS